MHYQSKEGGVTRRWSGLCFPVHQQRTCVIRRECEMSKSTIKALMVGASLLLSANAFAVPISVDLSSWGAETLAGGGVSGGGSNWVVQAGNDAVLQTVNGNASIFFEAGANAQGTALAGKIRVTTTSDDDFIGFVLATMPVSSTPPTLTLSWSTGSRATKACAADWVRLDSPSPTYRAAIFPASGVTPPASSGSTTLGASTSTPGSRKSPKRTPSAPPAGWTIKSSSSPSSSTRVS